MSSVIAAEEAIKIRERRRSYSEQHRDKWPKVCDWCGDPFKKGETPLEVVIRSDPNPEKVHYFIHDECFDDTYLKPAEEEGEDE